MTSDSDIDDDGPEPERHVQSWVTPRQALAFTRRWQQFRRGRKRIVVEFDDGSLHTFYPRTAVLEPTRFPSRRSRPPR